MIMLLDFELNSPQNYRLAPNIINANTQRINVLYGGLEPNMTNVYFTNGQLDPWKPVGRQSDLNSEAPAIVIPCMTCFDCMIDQNLFYLLILVVAHVPDLESISIDDSSEMLESKRRIADLIKIWLNT